MHEEALRFFQERPGYHRFMLGLRVKIESYGAPVGHVVLENLTEEEKRCLYPILSRKERLQTNKVNVSCDAFQTVILSSKFEDLNVIELLERYFGKPLVSKKQAREIRNKEWQQTLENLARKYPAKLCEQWLGLLAKDPASKSKHIGDKNNRERTLSKVCEALSQLTVDGTVKRLPAFATQIFKNPHALDLNTDVGREFLRALCKLSGFKSMTKAEEMVKIYYDFGLIRDDVSATVRTYGLTAAKDGDVHPMWSGALHCGEPLILSLRNLLEVSEVKPFLGDRVFVVENPCVFSDILDETGDLRLPLICASGQFNLAVLRLFDLLCSSVAQIYYSGDFDPEGLAMAKRMADRYPGRVSFWRYDIASYKECLSDEHIDDKRLAKLKQVANNELAEVACLMRETKKAGYQETITNSLLSDIQALKSCLHGTE